MVRHVAREYHGVRPRLVRLVRDAVERREIEHVPRSGGHDPVETARLHGVKQTIEVAKALRQRRTREGIDGRGARCVHHDRFSVAFTARRQRLEFDVSCASDSPRMAGTPPRPASKDEPFPPRP